MDWLYGISITCFAASYAAAFALEVSRLFFKAPLPRILSIAFVVAGMFAHTVYLSLQTGSTLNPRGLWLGNWSAWCLAGGWVMMAASLWFSLRRSATPLGIILIPVAMVLIAVGSWIHQDSDFTEIQAKSMWNMLHGAALLLGTVSVAVGCVFGVIYLYQAHRLKNKMLPSARYRLPSLEWLQISGERTLWTSVTLLAIGLISGFVVNQINARLLADSSQAVRVLPWSDPVVWSSGILFLWLLAVGIFNLCYQPAREGRKVAYLVVANFVFLILELSLVLAVGHGTVPSPGPDSSASSPVIDRANPLSSVDDGRAA